MTKKIVKVMVFYSDGTFEECTAGTEPKKELTYPPLTYPPGVRGPVTPGCPKCGEFRVGVCAKAGCPNTAVRPWDNGDYVVD